MTVEIDVARDFAKAPGPREIKDGAYSGELFRIEHLIPALKTNEQVVINLEGCTGFTTSFLDEAFGGAVRDLGREAASKMTFISPGRPHRVQLAERYVKRALESL